MPTLPESECATGLITSKGRKVYSFIGMLGMKHISRIPLIFNVSMNRSKFNNDRKIDVIAVKKN